MLFGAPFDERVSDFKSRYLTSELLIKLVDNLLEKDSAKRPLPGEVDALLAPYEDAILGFKKFQADSKVMQASVRRYNESRKI